MFWRYTQCSRKKERRDTGALLQHINMARNPTCKREDATCEKSSTMFRANASLRKHLERDTRDRTKRDDADELGVGQNDKSQRGASKVYTNGRPGYFVRSGRGDEDDDGRIGRRVSVTKR